MTIRDLLRGKTYSYPDSIFTAKGPEGEGMLCAWDFIEGGKIFREHPGILDWEVTKDHFTLEEIKEYKSR